MIEPLQIHLPATNYTTTAAIKTEKSHSGSSTSSTSSSTAKNSSSASKRASKAAKGNKNINDCIQNLHQQHQSKGSETKVEPNGTGCSRTVPLTWNQALQQLQSNVNTSIASSYANCSTADTAPHTTATLLQIKREPCQVSEVTTSNNLIATTSFSGTPAIIKIEQKSPTTTSSSLASISSSMDSASNNTSGGQQNNGTGQVNLFLLPCQCSFLLLIVIPFCSSSGVPSTYNTAGAAIPIGIAVGRQRLQDTTNQSLPQLQPKDLNRFSLGLADLGEFREARGPA